MLRTRRMSVCLLAALLTTPAIALAQSSGGGSASSMFSNLANPAIGMNALFSAQAAHTLDQPYGFSFDEAEISLISVVDPYWTLSSNIVFNGNATVDPEEVWVRNTSLPSVQLKLGKHGMLHPHAFPFIQAPIVLSNTIGEEGFKDPGVEASWLTPLPWFSELTGGVYRSIAASDENPLDFGSKAHDNIPLGGHFKNLLDVSDETTLEIGLSGLTGKGIDANRHTAWGADVTFRNVPARTSNQHGWILQSEYLQKGTSAAGAYRREQDGEYVSFQYRLSQVWWTGARAEQARQSSTDFVVDQTGAAIPAKISRGSVNIAWTASEFSFLRLEYSHAKADAGVHPTDDRLMLQLSYTIGYHPAHAY